MSLVRHLTVSPYLLSSTQRCLLARHHARKESKGNIRFRNSTEIFISDIVACISLSPFPSYPRVTQCRRKYAIISFIILSSKFVVSFHFL